MENFILSIHAQKVIYERKINLGWIENAINNPDKIEVDAECVELEHKLKIVKENGNKVLRVICKMSVKPVLIVMAFPVFRQLNLIEG
ncbi:MAG: DUF4258 domain-containing protein [Ignavibacteriaceae bacterium]